jgi:WD40 repeat protein
VKTTIGLPAATAFLLFLSATACANPIVLSGHKGAVAHLEFSPDGKLLASAGVEYSIRIWDVESGKQVAVLRGHIDTVTRLTWSPKGKLLASASRDKSVRIWDVEKEKEVATKQHGSSVRLIAWRPDGEQIASVEHVTRENKVEKLFLWDPATGKASRDFKEELSEFRSIAWSPDGEVLAACGEWQKILLLNPHKDEPKLVIDAQALTVDTVAWSPDGKILASGGSEKKGKNRGTVKLWNPTTGKLIRSIVADDYEVTRIQWKPDGKSLAIDANDDTIRIWSSTTGRLQRSIRVAGNAHDGFDVLWRPDGKVIATSTELVAQLYDAASGRVLFLSDPSEHNFIRTLAWHPEGKSLAAGNDRGDVLVWIQNGK